MANNDAVAKGQVLEPDGRIEAWVYRVKRRKRGITKITANSLERADKPGKKLEVVKKIRKGFLVKIHLGFIIHFFEIRTTLNRNDLFVLMDEELATVAR